MEIDFTRKCNDDENCLSFQCNFNRLTDEYIKKIKYNMVLANVAVTNIKKNHPPDSEIINDLIILWEKNFECELFIKRIKEIHNNHNKIMDKLFIDIFADSYNIIRKVKAMCIKYKVNEIEIKGAVNNKRIFCDLCNFFKSSEMIIMNMPKEVKQEIINSKKSIKGNLGQLMIFESNIKTKMNLSGNIQSMSGNPLHEKYHLYKDAVLKKEFIRNFRIEFANKSWKTSYEIPTTKDIYKKSMDFICKFRSLLGEDHESFPEFTLSVEIIYIEYIMRKLVYDVLVSKGYEPLTKIDFDIIEECYGIKNNMEIVSANNNQEMIINSRQ